jgi:hypothetical protein
VPLIIPGLNYGKEPFGTISAIKRNKGGSLNGRRIV